MSPVARRVWIAPAALAAAVLLLWAFPTFWYSAKGEGERLWFSERSELPGWNYRAIPVDQSAEKVLVADRIVNGEFKGSQGTEVHVFSAKRFEEKANEIGLFIHTPDRCWVEGGWKIEDSSPAVKEILLHGIRVPVERRIFNYGAHRELVYFFGLIAGQALPYRLDHNLSVGLRSSFGKTHDRALVRGSDALFWERLWESFKSRRELLGPKQFVRISTTIGAEEVAAADARLEAFLSDWLAPANYDEEKRHWQLAAASSKTAPN